MKFLFKKLPIIAFDVCSIPIAWYLAYWLRYHLHPFSTRHNDLTYAASALIIITILQIGFYCYFQVYRGLWRYTSLNDASRILRAVGGTIMFVLPLFYLTELLFYIPRAVLLLYGLVLGTCWGGARLLVRYYFDRTTSRSNKTGSHPSTRVLIVGAGQAAESLIRDLKRSSVYLPMGIVDDNCNKRGLEMHGVRVLGIIPDLTQYVKQYDIEMIFIAIPSANSQAMRRIVGYCEACAIPFHTLPSLQALVSGQVKVNALRKVNIDDLLGRHPVHLSWDKIATTIHGMRILVTGGGGSIGSELCRQIAALAPEQLMIIDNCEYNLYQIDQELRSSHPSVLIEVALISVTDAVAINAVFSRFKPDIVFHAAAYKHVPLLESQIRIAVQNNILGTQLVAQASVDADVNKFILISTDKAVNPTNIMGTTKRVAELYCQNLNKLVKTQFITVRFGNVLGSMGSVVPLFQKQLEKGGPLTVTHPDIERYFMTIPEASQLILQAMVNGVGGEIFVLDMGEPIKIRYLAEQMIRLAGKIPGQDIQIEYTGLRPGEKLFEELFHESETLAQTDHTQLFKARFREMDWDELTQTLRMMALACSTNQDDELLVLLKSLVPEFSYDAFAFSV